VCSGATEKRVSMGNPKHGAGRRAMRFSGRATSGDYFAA
jgi:hypothetical protein